jgi:hypothetical protein
MGTSEVVGVDSNERKTALVRKTHDKTKYLFEQLIS